MWFLRFFFLLLQICFMYYLYIIYIKLSIYFGNHFLEVPYHITASSIHIHSRANKIFKHVYFLSFSFHTPVTSPEETRALISSLTKTFMMAKSSVLTTALEIQSMYDVHGKRKTGSENSVTPVFTKCFLSSPELADLREKNPV